MPGLTLTWKAQQLGGMKNVRQCRRLVAWASERIDDGLVLDVGAHFGAFCVPLLMAEPRVRVHAFEPNPEAVRALAGMVALNGVRDRFAVHELAVADRHTTGSLSVPDDGEFSGLATLGQPRRFNGGGLIPVEVTSLDFWAEGHDLANLKLIKLDVEGAEYLALIGAERVITEFHPFLIIEYQRQNATQLGVGLGMVERLLTRWGYSFARRQRDLFCEWPSSSTS